MDDTEKDTPLNDSPSGGEPVEEILLFDGEEKSPETVLAEKKERRGLFLLIGLMAAALIAAVLWLVLDPLGTGKAKEEAEAESHITEPLPYGDTELYVPDTGNAACALLITPEGKTLLADCGDAEHWPDLNALLTRLGIDRIDMLLLTHMHENSIEALPSLLSTCEIGEIYMSDQSNTGDACVSALKALEQTDIPIQKIALSPTDTGPITLALGDYVTVTLLSPFEGTYIDANNFSLMARVSYGNTAVLVTGDAGIAEEKIAVKALSDSYFRSTVLLVAQNGDKDATSESFLNAVRPTYGIIQAKSGPSDKVLERLYAVGTTALATDTLGEIHMALDGFAARVIE